MKLPQPGLKNGGQSLSAKLEFPHIDLPTSGRRLKAFRSRQMMNHDLADPLHRPKDPQSTGLPQLVKIGKCLKSKVGPDPEKQVGHLRMVECVLDPQEQVEARWLN